MPSNLDVWRVSVVTLLWLDLIFWLPNIKSFWGQPYSLKERPVPKIRPYLTFAVFTVASAFLFFGVSALLSSFIVWLVCRRLFIKERWNSLFRGGGAPGFMLHHQFMYMTLFLFAYSIDHSQGSLHLSLKLYQLDLGIIIFCSGMYKAFNGYLNKSGMEYGCANPLWCYWYGFFSQLSPSNPFFLFQNLSAVFVQLASGTCLVGGVFFGGPLTSIGAFLLASMFFYLIFVIRLGRLSLLMVCSVLPLLPWLQWNVPLTLIAHVPTWIEGQTLVIRSFSILIYCLAGLLPLIKLGQYWNFYFNRQLPMVLQTSLNNIQNFIPVIIWRVFTADVTNFFVRIYSIDTNGDKTSYISEFEPYNYNLKSGIAKMSRFLSVSESITLTTLFTTIRYFPSKPELFERRLFLYADSLHIGEKVLFEAVSIVKGPETFVYKPLFVVEVRLSDRSISYSSSTGRFEFSETAQFSRVREGKSYGSYEVLTDR